MASSVSSAKEMERWARERREKTQRTVPVAQAASRSFNSFVPDFEQLAKYEDKAQRLAERQEDREHELEVVPVINVMGSTAGAGSGEFHTYRGYRTKEMARLADFEKVAKIEAEQKKWEASRAEAEAEAEAKHAKGASKRNKKKEKRKAAVEAEREKRAAKRVAGGGAAEGSGEAAEGGEAEPDEHADE